MGSLNYNVRILIEAFLSIGRHLWNTSNDQEFPIALLTSLARQTITHSVTKPKQIMT